jgi:predicted GNAT family acetyltransferase
MPDVRENPSSGRFEMEEGGHVVFADVRRNGGRIIIDHVEAPLELRGTGAAGRFMEGLVAQTRRDKAILVPICPYARDWLARHPEAADVTNG